MIKNPHKIKFFYILLISEILIGLVGLLTIHNDFTGYVFILLLTVTLVITLRILMHLQYYEQKAKEKSQGEVLRQAMAAVSTLAGLR